MKLPKDNFFISNGKAVYDNNFPEQFREFLKQEHKTDYHIEITKKDIKKLWCHKFYRGTVLPEIARESFSGILAQAHYELKKMFLYIPCEDWRNIPEKHYNRIQVFKKEFVVDGEVTEKIIGYMPSTSVLTEQEFVDYINNCIFFALQNELHVSFGEEAYILKGGQK